MNYNLLKDCIWCTGTGIFAKGEKCLFCRGKGKVLPAGYHVVGSNEAWKVSSSTGAAVDPLYQKDVDTLNERYAKAIEGFMREEDQTTKGSV